LSVKVIFQKAARVYVENDEQNMDSYVHNRTTLWATETTNAADAYYWEDCWTPNRSDQHWNDGANDGGSSLNGTVFVQSTGGGYTNLCTEQMSWLPDLWPWLNTGTRIFEGYCGSGSNWIDPASIWPEHCEVSDPAGPTFTFGREVGWNYSRWRGDEADQTYTRHAQTKLKLATGGRAAPGHESLIHITGWAKEVLSKRTLPPFNPSDSQNYRTIPPEQLRVGTLGNLDANGDLWLVLPDGDPDVTIYGPALCYYIFSVLAMKLTLVHHVTHGAAYNSSVDRTMLAAC